MDGMIWLARGGRAEAEIRVPADAGETVLFAAGELRRYVAMMSGAGLPVTRRGAPRHALWVGAPGQPDGSPPSAALEGDSYAVRPRPGGLWLLGARPRATLYAVYDLLGQLGCRWFEPGPSGESVPRRGDLGLAPRLKTVSPRFAIRGLVHGPYPDLADWMAKNRMNSTTVYGLRMDEIVASGGLEALRLRDMSAEFGHHDFKRYFISPQTYLEAHPEWFGLRAGVRTGGLRGVCLCLTNAAMTEQFARNVAALLHAHPWVDRVSLWPDDGFRPCECEACRREYSGGRNTSDYILRFVNRIASEFPDRRFSHLAYQAAKVFPLVERPLANVDLCSAETNPALLAAWRRWLDWDIPAGRRSNRRMYVYAYWGGYTAYALQTRHHPSDVEARLKDLEDAGADGFLTQSNFFYPTAYATNLIAAARLSWRGRGTAAHVMRDYCRQGFGAWARAFEHWMAEMDGLHGAFGRNTLPASRLARGFMDAPENSRAVQMETVGRLAAAYARAAQRFGVVARGRKAQDKPPRAAAELAAFDYNRQAVLAYAEAFRGMDLARRAEDAKETDRASLAALASAADESLAQAAGLLGGARRLLDSMLAALGPVSGEAAEKAGVAAEMLASQALEIEVLRRGQVFVDAGLAAHRAVAASDLTVKRSAGSCRLEPYVRTATHLSLDSEQLVFRAGEGEALEIVAPVPEPGLYAVTVSALRRHGFGRWRVSLDGGPPVVVDMAHADAAMQEFLIGEARLAEAGAAIVWQPCPAEAGQAAGGAVAPFDHALVIDAVGLTLRRGRPAGVRG